MNPKMVGLSFCRGWMMIRVCGSFGKDRPFAKFVFSVIAAWQRYLESKFVELLQPLA